MKTFYKSFFTSLFLIAHISAFAIPPEKITPVFLPCAVDAGADKTICFGSNTVLDITVTGGTAPYTYSWSGDSLNSTTVEDPVVYPISSPATYTVTVTDANGCTASDNVTVTTVPNTQLVVNGNFEISGSPLLRGQVDLATPWIKATGDADLFDEDYHCPLNITSLPDPCGINPLDYTCIGIPCNHFGFQDHRKPTGSKYAGLWAGVGKIAASIPNPPISAALDIAVEAIEIPLASPLVPGQNYRLVFYASKGENGEVNALVAPAAKYNIKLATTLTTNTFYQPVNAPVIASGTVSTTTSWQKIVHIFTATTAANYLIIESAIDSLLYIAPPGSPYIHSNDIQSYFYIDDISLKYTCESDTVLHAFAGPDQNICGGSSITLGGNPPAAAGTPPYNYSWSPGGDTTGNPTVTQPIGTTTYTLIVTDQNELSDTDEATITFSNMSYDAGPPYYIICAGTPTVIGGPPPSGGIPPYSYIWTPATGLSSNTVAQPTASPTTNTWYKITITDSAGCVYKDSVYFYVYPNPVANAGPDHTICEGTNTTLNGSATSGTSPYIYRWSENGNFISNAQSIMVSPNSTATYVLEVEDARGCIDRDTVVVTVNPRPDIDAADAGKCTGSVGSVTIGSAATGGTGPYTYTWSHGLGNNATHSVNPSSTTVYTVTATDANGCVSETEFITVKIHPLPGANANTDREVCPGGSVVIGGTHTGSGDGGFTYLWSPSTGLSPSATVAQPTASPSSTTSYVVTVTNSNGCQAKDTVVVTVLPSCPGGGGGGVGGGCTYPVSDAGEDITVCEGDTTVIGGSPTASDGTPGYIYCWTPSTGLNDTTIANPTVSGISRQLYKVLVTDSCGLTSQDIVTVTMTSPTVNAGPDDTVCSATSKVIGNPAMGGTPPYSYSWTASSGSAPPPNATVTVSPTTTTTYIVTVTDANTCQDKDTVVISTYPQATIDAGPDQNVCYEGDSVTIGNNATGGTSPYTYAWYPERGLSSTTVAAPRSRPYVTTHYTVTVTDSNGCMASDNVSVFVNSAVYLYAGPDKTIACPGDTVMIGEEAELGTPPYTYSWSPTSGLGSPFSAQTSASPAVTTSYVLTAIDSKGCTAEDTVVVTVGSGPAAHAGPDTIICTGSCTTIGTTATGGTGPYTYSWSPSTGLSNPAIAAPNACPDSTTTYIVTVTDSNQCHDTDTVTVTVETISMADAGPDTTICLGSCTVIGTTATGGSAPYTYSWSPTAGLSDSTVATPTACPNTTTTYIVTVTDTNQCVDRDTVEVQVIVSPAYIVNEGFEAGTLPLMRGEIEKAPVWMDATGDPDLFDTNYTTCSVICGLQPLDYHCVGAPCNHFGDQQPHQGSRYGGLWAAIKVVVTNALGVHIADSIKIVEAMETKLTQALDTASTYRLSFYISKAEKGEVGENDPLLVNSCAAYTIKMSTDFASNDLYQPVLRDIVHSGTVCDAVNWQLETFIFQPADTFRYLIIESKPTKGLLSTDVFGVDTISAHVIQSYFYIDDIHLEKICEAGSMRVVNMPSVNPEPELKQGVSANPLNMQIAPNPNAGTFTVTYTLGEQSDRLPEIILYDAMGKALVRQQLSYGDGGLNTLDINPGNTGGELIPGIYFVRLSNGQQTVVKRVSVIR